MQMPTISCPNDDLKHPQSRVMACRFSGVVPPCFFSHFRVHFRGVWPHFSVFCHSVCHLDFVARSATKVACSNSSRLHSPGKCTCSAFSKRPCCAYCGEPLRTGHAACGVDAWHTVDLTARHFWCAPLIPTLHVISFLPCVQSLSA